MEHDVFEYCITSRQFRNYVIYHNRFVSMLRERKRKTLLDLVLSSNMLVS